MSHFSSNDPYWREAMAPYARPVLRRSIVDILTSVVPFLVLWGVMYMALDVSYWLVLLISVPTAGFLLRTFIVFHDCTHGSFLPSRRANLWVGRSVRAARRSSRSRTGATTTPSITARPAISTGAAPATSRR